MPECSERKKAREASTPRGPDARSAPVAGHHGIAEPSPAKLPKPTGAGSELGIGLKPGSMDPQRPGILEPRPFDPRLPSRKRTPSRGVLPWILPNVHACSASTGTLVIGKWALLKL